MKPFLIIKDTREKKIGKGYSFEPSSECLGYIVETLKTADYSIQGLEHIVRIERKASVSEFATNICENRFWAEMKRMEEFPLRFLLLEFSIEDVLRWPIGSTVPRKKWSQIKTTPNFILKKISEIQVNYNLQVIFANNRDNGQILAYNIFKRVQEKYVG